MTELPTICCFLCLSSSKNIASYYTRALTRRAEIEHEEKHHASYYPALHTSLHASKHIPYSGSYGSTLPIASFCFFTQKMSSVCSFMYLILYSLRYLFPTYPLSAYSTLSVFSSKSSTKYMLSASLSSVTFIFAMHWLIWRTFFCFRVSAVPPESSFN